MFAVSNIKQVSEDESIEWHHLSLQNPQQNLQFLSCRAFYECYPVIIRLRRKINVDTKAAGLLIRLGGIGMCIEEARAC